MGRCGYTPATLDDFADIADPRHPRGFYAARTTRPMALGAGVPSMRTTVALGVVALSLSGAGCTLVRDATSLTVFRMREAVQDRDEEARNRNWAHRAWEQVRAACPRDAYSQDYAAGFEDGYAYHLFRGGN